MSVVERNECDVRRTSDVDEYLEAVQAVGDHLLSELNRVCDTLDIPFFVYGGTALGAIRNGDWIPWDDDIDVVMFREDFERFREHGPVLLGPDVRFSDQRSSTAHRKSIPRLLYLKSRRRPHGRTAVVDPPDRLHLGLDIFILDKCPERRLALRSWLAAIRLLEKLIIARQTDFRAAISYDQVSWLRRLVEGAVVLAARPIRRNWLVAAHLRTCTAYSAAGRDLFVGTNHFKQKFRRLQLSRSDFFPRRLIPFSNVGEVPVASRVEEILARQYGETWRTPPPVEEQLPIHANAGIVIDFGDHSLEYLPASVY